MVLRQGSRPTSQIEIKKSRFLGYASRTADEDQARDFLAEVRRAPAYATLADNDWHWALQFVREGSASLANYPDFHRVVPDEDGVWRGGAHRPLARRAASSARGPSGRSARYFCSSRTPCFLVLGFFTRSLPR